MIDGEAALRASSPPWAVRFRAAAKFGTVLGIIKAFRDLSLETQSASSAVMAGISEALVATAVGLLVAIPAVVAYNYLKRQVSKTLTSSDALNQQLFLKKSACPKTCAMTSFWSTR